MTLYFSPLQVHGESWKEPSVIYVPKKLFAVCAVPFPTNGWMWRKDAKDADGLQVEWGSHIDPVLLDENFPPGNMI